MAPIQVSELNHAVLYVRDLDVAVGFYRDVLGFRIVDEMPGRAAFLRGGASANHHDLGLFAVGAHAPRPPGGATGLYHLAWRVPSIQELARAREVLADAGALRGSSDHGVSKSLYAADPDGNELEVMYLLPEDEWGEDATGAVVRPLDLDAELARRA